MGFLGLCAGPGGRWPRGGRRAWADVAALPRAGPQTEIFPARRPEQGPGPQDTRQAEGALFAEASPPPRIMTRRGAGPELRPCPIPREGRGRAEAAAPTHEGARFPAWEEKRRSRRCPAQRGLSSARRAGGFQ